MNKSPDVLFQLFAEVPAPKVVVVVVDGRIWSEPLFASQIVELGYPTIIALT